jgi:hypothetical protein
VTITTTNWRASLAALLATGMLLLGACGGDDDDASDESTDQSDEDAANTDDSTDASDAPTPSIDSDAPAADSDFCQGAMAAITASADPENPESDAGLAAAEALEAPDEIADAWANVLSTSRELQEIDYSDPEAQQRAMDAYNAIAADQAAVISYLQNDCGINVGGDSTATTDPTATTGG